MASITRTGYKRRGGRNTPPRTGELKYDISGNFTFMRGKPVYVERNPDANSYLNCWSNLVARRNNQTCGYRYIGQFQSMEEVLASPIQDEKGNRTIGYQSLSKTIYIILNTYFDSISTRLRSKYQK